MRLFRHKTEQQTAVYFFDHVTQSDRKWSEGGVPVLLTENIKQIQTRNLCEY